MIYSSLYGAGLAPAKVLLRLMHVSFSLVEKRAEPDGTSPPAPSPTPRTPAAMELGMAQAKREGVDLFFATDLDADHIGVAAAPDGRASMLSGNEVGLLVFDFVAMRYRGKVDLLEKAPEACPHQALRLHPSRHRLRQGVAVGKLAVGLPARGWRPPRPGARKRQLEELGWTPSIPVACKHGNKLGICCVPNGAHGGAEGQ